MTISLTSEEMWFIGGLTLGVILGMALAYIFGYLRIRRLRKQMSGDLRAFVMQLEPSGQKVGTDSKPCQCQSCRMQREFESEIVKTRAAYEKQMGKSHQK